MISEDLVSKTIQLIGLVLVVIGGGLAVAGLLLLFGSGISRFIDSLPSYIKPLIYVSIRVGSTEIILSPLLILILTLIFYVIGIKSVK